MEGRCDELEVLRDSKRFGLVIVGRGAGVGRVDLPIHKHPGSRGLLGMIKRVCVLTKDSPWSDSYFRFLARYGRASHCIHVAIGM